MACDPLFVTCERMYHSTPHVVLLEKYYPNASTFSLSDLHQQIQVLETLHVKQLECTPLLSRHVLHAEYTSWIGSSNNLRGSPSWSFKMPCPTQLHPTSVNLASNTLQGPGFITLEENATMQFNNGKAIDGTQNFLKVFSVCQNAVKPGSARGWQTHAR